jgi:chromosome segregation ATPase
MSELPSDPAYGATRQRRATVSYAELERAATTLLRSGLKPGIESLRQALGGGSPQTIQTLLNRYWRELGERIDGSAPALKRMPADVADLADELWQRALHLAAEASTRDDNAAQERLEHLRSDHELRSHVLASREKELANLLESREQTVRELESHLRTTMSLLSRSQASIQSLEARAVAAETRTDEYRQRLTNVVRRATAGHRAQKPNPAIKALAKKINRPVATTKLAGKKRSPIRRRRAASAPGSNRSKRRPASTKRQ